MGLLKRRLRGESNAKIAARTGTDAPSIIVAVKAGGKTRPENSGKGKGKGKGKGEVENSGKGKRKGKVEGGKGKGDRPANYMAGKQKERKKKDGQKLSAANTAITKTKKIKDKPHDWRCVVCNRMPDLFF